MKRPLRPCRQYGCHKPVRSGYCELHRKLADEKFKARTKEDKKRYDENRGTARERGYDRKWELFRSWYLRKHPLCEKCGNIAYIAHHIQELSKGGAKFDPDNIEALCYKCHNSIHHK